MDVERNIVAKLAEVESETGVRVLHAVESGSRAWGVRVPGQRWWRAVHLCGGRGLSYAGAL